MGNETYSLLSGALGNARKIICGSYICMVSSECRFWDFQASKLKSSEEFDFMTVIDKMSFIKNLAYWSAHFRNGIVQISDKDWQVITAKAKTAV